MHRSLVLLAMASVGGAPGTALSAEPPARSTTAEPAPRLVWRSPLAGLPAAADPTTIDWRASNQTVYRLNGHVGHWRGALQLPPIEPELAPSNQPIPERRP